MGILRQCFFAFIACNTCLCMGLMYAWPSSTFKLFASANTTLHRPMNEAELALFGSLSSVGAVIGTPVAGYLMDAVGRKWCTIISCLTQVLSWGLVVASYRVEVILTAIFLSGLGGSSSLVVPVYVGEFCQESIRGALTSLPIVFYGIGMLISYLLGGCLEYDVMSYVCLTVAVFGVGILGVLKESPMYLMKIGREEEAIQAVSFFRGVSRDSKETTQELETIKRALNPVMDEDEDETPKEELLKPQQIKQKANLTKWQFIKKSSSTVRALIIIFLLMSLSMTQGVSVLLVYAEPLFSVAVPDSSATVGSVMLAIGAVVAGFIAAYLVDTMGRRALMTWSSVVSAICNVIIATQLYHIWAPHWVTACALYAFCFSSSAGAGTVPYVMLAEAFLPEVRSLLSMLMVEWAWVCNFVILYMYNPIATSLGLGAVFSIFSVVCLISALFSHFYVPETMGLPVDAIQLLFLKKKSRNIRCC